jgi:hypothetical protein
MSLQQAVDPFDRNSGSGSLSKKDGWADGKSIFDNEWGSEAATTFKPDGNDGKNQPLSKNRREQLQRLYELQNGKYNQNRSTEIQKSHIDNDLETFMSVLEMPSPQRDTVREIVENLDMSSNNFSRRYEKILLTVCSLVADEALSNKQNPSLDERLFLSDEFRELMEATKMSSGEHRKIRVAVREKSNYF